MALNNLVGADCGGNNPLVQLSNVINQNAFQTPQMSDVFVSEFLNENVPAPETFDMNKLLNNLPASKNQGNNRSNMNMYVPNNQFTMFAHIHPSTSFMPPKSLYSMHSQVPNTLNVIPIQYIDECDVIDQDIKGKAKEYVDNVKDDADLAYDQFMSFMKKISAGELSLNDTENEASQSNISNSKVMENISDKFKEDWAKFGDNYDHWNTESAYGISENYTFTEGNVMLENKSALEIGKEKLKLGDIPGAVMCFEAAVQQAPESAEAWFLLGTTQAENEQDIYAITALKKALQLDPKQTDAYITLAAAYTNENMPKYAFNALLDWLKSNPKYNDLIPRDVDVNTFDNKQCEKYVESLYIKAAQMSPESIDPDVQNALGVLFNISQEYDKAVDCFKTALMVASNDPKLWNRLGATLANSDRSEEAVSAYHEALNLEPGFIRARYNVGITCMNLGAHKQAAEHFLEALNQQHKAKEMHPNSSFTDTSSTTIWSTLRMVCAFMGRHDLSKLVDDRNLEELNKCLPVCDE